MKDESGFSLEIVILLVLATFMLLFGVLLFRIQTGALPYNPDSTYGLFLVIVSFQIITMGKTPFGDFRRSWLLIAIGICTAILGMTVCFIPRYLTGFARVSVGLVLFGGGLSLLVQLFAREEKARTWLRIGGILRQLAVACALVYALTIGLGAITLFPGITTDAQTAIVLILYGAGFAYLAWCIWRVRQVYPPEAHTQNIEDPDSRKYSGMFQEASLPLSMAILILLGVLLTFLGLLLFPVNLGLLPFSPDGQLGLLLTVMAIQIMTLGDTPVGHFERSWSIMLLGLVFAALGIVSSIVPGVLTGMITMLLGILNVTGGASSLLKRYLPRLKEAGKPPKAPVAVPPEVGKTMATQTMLDWVALAFGISMLVPGLIPGLLVAAILVVNGLLLFRLAGDLWKLTGMQLSMERDAALASGGE